MRYCCSIQRQGKPGVLVSGNREAVSLQPQEEQEGKVRLEAPQSGLFSRVPLR